MSAFDRLHPSLQHHIVNSLNWRVLKPLQEKSIADVHDGRHLILLAPTAGGKTEAALFSLFSRMLYENWTGLSVIYICPVKALLNNLDDRISRYTGLLGRRSAVWHGDTGQGLRKRILKEPPDCLLTTPESIEAMLISTRTVADNFFKDLRAVIVDEIHALAGDDRGWHLLSILERLTKISGREIQRIGLSATIGNPRELLDWLCGHCSGIRNVLLPEVEKSEDVDVKLDYVGSIDNAAIVISRLHRGEKRLVFCDSRSRVEQLAIALRRQGVTTYVSHSSLSADERKRSEAAFQSETDCVIAATSTLELGIDIGDLDRVIQIDAPATVSSFLQRLGRTGRRKGRRKNCLFLATTNQALLHAAGLIQLWMEGYVEPVIPPALPCHVFVQQILGLILQEKGIGINTWRDWIGRLPVFRNIPDDHLDSIFEHMLSEGILAQDQGILGFGRTGEKLYGFKNFMNICSTFAGPSLFEVKSGRETIGFVDEITFAGHDKDQVVLLAGKGWKIKDIQWTKRIAGVEPTQLDGRSIWLGKGPVWSEELCLSIKKVLMDTTVASWWSNRAEKKLDELRVNFDYLVPDSTVIVREGNRDIWWTFAGKRINLNLVMMLENAAGLKSFADNLSVRFDRTLADKDLAGIKGIGQSSDPAKMDMSQFINDENCYKFHECLPRKILESMTVKRFVVNDRTGEILNQGMYKVINTSRRCF